MAKEKSGNVTTRNIIKNAKNGAGLPAPTSSTDARAIKRTAIERLSADWRRRSFQASQASPSRLIAESLNRPLPSDISSLFPTVLDLVNVRSKNKVYPVIKVQRRAGAASTVFVPLALKEA